MNGTIGGAAPSMRPRLTGMPAGPSMPAEPNSCFLAKPQSNIDQRSTIVSTWPEGAAASQASEGPCRRRAAAAPTTGSGQKRSGATPGRTVPCTLCQNCAVSTLCFMNTSPESASPALLRSPITAAAAAAAFAGHQGAPHRRHRHLPSSRTVSSSKSTRAREPQDDLCCSWADRARARGAHSACHPCSGVDRSGIQALEGAPGSGAVASALRTLGLLPWAPSPSQPPLTACAQVPDTRRQQYELQQEIAHLQRQAAALNHPDTFAQVRAP